jgi:hypothetical protein
MAINGILPELSEIFELHQVLTGATTVDKIHQVDQNLFECLNERKRKCRKGKFASPTNLFALRD